MPHRAERGLLQRSVPITGPQLLPCAMQNSASVSGAQPPQTFGMPPPPQVFESGHMPQLKVRSAEQASVAEV